MVGESLQESVLHQGLGLDGLVAGLRVQIKAVLGHKWGDEVLAEKLFPIEFSKPGMFFDLVDTIVSKPVVGLSLKQSVQEVD